MDVRSRGSVDVLPAEVEAHLALLRLDLDPSGARTIRITRTRDLRLSREVGAEASVIVTVAVGYGAPCEPQHRYHGHEGYDGHRAQTSLCMDASSQIEPAATARPLSWLTEIYDGRFRAGLPMPAEGTHLDQPAGIRRLLLPSGGFD
jgi:hypothetical protein